MAEDIAEGARSAHDPAASGPTAAEAAAYIERMIEALREVAEPHRELAMLDYILGIARQEAAARAKDRPR